MYTDTLKNTGTASVLDLSRSLQGSGLKGLIAIKIDSTSYVTLQGSINNTDYFVIETFTADTIKEITLCPYMRVNGAADTSNNDTIGNSTATIYFNTSAFA